MARTPLPRFALDYVVAVNLAGTDIVDAHRRALELEDVIRRAVTTAVRNHGSRTAHVITVTGPGPDVDALAEQ